ncbi:MAG: hypothetical protein IT374_03490 [Polyangiaceae bacterium]|nr:hypothetical protein [Polyangiaceae bacterium]
MRLEHWGGVYVALGVAFAVALARRSPGASRLDLALVCVAWPLYAPSALAPRAAPPLCPEIARLAAVIAEVRDPAWRPLLPGPAELSSIDRALGAMARRASDLSRVVAAEPAPGARLLDLAARAESEARQMRGALDALRLEVVALRFSDGATGGERERVGALVARLRDAQGGLDDGLS